MHNTIYVPGHFHGTVVVGTTLAFMARDLSRAAADLPARNHLAEARQDPALSVRHRRRRHLAVHDGRRHARRGAAALGHRLHGRQSVVRPFGRRLPDDGLERHLRDDRGDRRQSSSCWSSSARCCSARRSSGGHKLTFPLHSGGGAAAAQYGSHGTVKLPGTIVLVAIFFVCFVLYYFINWKYLSELWLFR